MICFSARSMASSSVRCLKFSPEVAGWLSRDIARQRFRNDELPGAQDDRPFHDILQFPDIARPRVLEADLQGALGDALDLPVVNLVELTDEMVRQRFDVAQTVPQGRNGESDHVDPVIEVFPEVLLGCHLVLQGSVGGRDDPSHPSERGYCPPPAR